MYFNSFLYVFAFLPLVFLLYAITLKHILSKYIVVVSSVIFYG